MPITQLKKLSLLFIGIESVEGTDVFGGTPTATRIVQCITSPQIRFGAEILSARPDLLNYALEEAAPITPAAKWFEVSGEIWLRGFGSAYSAGNFPEVDAILQGFGMGVTTNFGAGVESYSYDTASTAMKTLTVYAYQALETGVLVKHVGLAGRTAKITFTLPAGGPGRLGFTIRCLYSANTDVGSPPAYTFQSAVPPVFGGASAWSLGSFTAAIIKEAMVDGANTLVPRLNGNATDAISGYIQAKRKNTFSARFEAQRISDRDDVTEWATNTNRQLVIKHPGGGGGGTQYNRVAITADKATIYDAPAFTDERGAMWVRSISGILSPEGTNRMQVVYN